jgi:DNA-binding transcriptional ArsR family regulator
MPGDVHEAVSRIASAIGNVTRSRILYHLMDGRARTSTELASAAAVNASTASEHLSQLHHQKLVQVYAQGRHRYYRLNGETVATILEQLGVLAGDAVVFAPKTPKPLRLARTCYDHLAGSLAVLWHDHLLASQWIAEVRDGYEVTVEGTRALHALGIDVAELRALSRRFAYPCLDWSERKPHIGGALGQAFLKTFLSKGWICQDLDSRAVSITRTGQIYFSHHLGWRDTGPSRPYGNTSL